MLVVGKFFFDICIESSKMLLKKLENKTEFNNQKLSKSYKRFSYLINELNGHDLSHNTINFINQHLELVNNAKKENDLRRQMKSSKIKILKILERKHGIAPKGYYTKLWTILGVFIIGIPSGAALGLILDSIEFSPVGWVLAAIICIRIGRAKDADLSKFGRQLNFRSRA